MENTSIILLAIIALAEILRLILTHKKTTKNQHFQQKLDGVEKMIWDLEFKLNKTGMIREDIREEYDNMKSRIATLDEQIKNWPKDKGEGDRKRIEDQKVLAERDANRFEAQMKGLDEEMYGAKPTKENPEGVQGITTQIESLRELISMLKSHITSL